MHIKEPGLLDLPTYRYELKSPSSLNKWTVKVKVIDGRLDNAEKYFIQKLAPLLNREFYGRSPKKQPALNAKEQTIAQRYDDED